MHEHYGELQLQSVNNMGRSNSVKRPIQDENTGVNNYTAVKSDKHSVESVVKFGMLDIPLKELLEKKNLLIISF